MPSIFPFGGLVLWNFEIKHGFPVLPAKLQVKCENIEAKGKIIVIFDKQPHENGERYEP